MIRYWFAPAALAGALLLCGQSQAEAAAAAPDSAPAQSRQRNADNDDGDPRKFFWFHREGVTQEAARTDIEYCLAQTSSIRAQDKESSGTGGLIGALIEHAIHSAIEGAETRRMRFAGMRMCMGVYGYSRYQVPEREWNEMMSSEDAVDRLTAYASGPMPTTERLAR